MLTDSLWVRTTMEIIEAGTGSAPLVYFAFLATATIDFANGGM
jgi:tRNA A58 N-methylase Trm61